MNWRLEEIRRDTVYNLFKNNNKNLKYIISERLEMECLHDVVIKFNLLKS